MEKLDPAGLYFSDYGAPPQSEPVFLTLRPPFKAFEASPIAKVLDETIKLARLTEQGFTAKSFRPTGATATIDKHIDPEIVQKVGRWKNSVFCTLCSLKTSRGFY